MSTIEEIQLKVTDLTSTLGSIDLKLDEVRARIAELVAGQPVSQEQLNALNELLTVAKDSASAVLTETTELA